MIETANADLKQAMKRALIKEKSLELLENSKDERGLPVFGVIEIEDENGNPVKTFKPEELFETEDYRKAAAYQARLADNHKLLAAYYYAEFEKRRVAETEAF
jgi:hypothetical protein